MQYVGAVEIQTFFIIFKKNDQKYINLNVLACQHKFIPLEVEYELTIFDRE